MIAGVAAAAVALGVAQLAAIPFGARTDARAAVGATVVDLTPGPIKEWAIAALGPLDKVFVSVAVVVTIAAIAALAGSIEAARRPLGSVALGLAGALGCLAVAARPGATAVDVLPALAGTVSGVVTLRLLVRRIDHAVESGGAGQPDRGRRGLMAWGLIGCGVLATAAGTVVSRWVQSVGAERNQVVLPRPRVAAPPIPAGVQPTGVALPDFVTAGSDFYRIDTALSVPQLSRNDWRLRVHGMVDRERSYTFADLADFELVERVITLTCASNPVGGDLVSTGVWLGYRLADLLAAAGVHADSDMLLSMSVDGFTAGTPVDALRTPGALLAIGLDGQALPVEHGYPARQLAARPAGGQLLGRDLAALELPVAGEKPWAAHDYRPSNRWRRGDPDLAADGHRPGRRHRLAHRGFHGDQLMAPVRTTSFAN